MYEHYKTQHAIYKHVYLNACQNVKYLICKVKVEHKPKLNGNREKY